MKIRERMQKQKNVLNLYEGYTGCHIQKRFEE